MFAFISSIWLEKVYSKWSKLNEGNDHKFKYIHLYIFPEVNIYYDVELWRFHSTSLQKPLGCVFILNLRKPSIEQRAKVYTDPHFQDFIKEKSCAFAVTPKTLSLHWPSVSPGCTIRGQMQHQFRYQSTPLHEQHRSLRGSHPLWSRTNLR